jgi:hypothetical protein
MLLIIASAAALSATAPLCSAEISLASNAHQASYQTVSTLRFQQVEPRFARYSRARSAQALTVAQEDRTGLLNELDGINSLSVKGG